MKRFFFLLLILAALAIPSAGVYADEGDGCAASSACSGGVCDDPAIGCYCATDGAATGACVRKGSAGTVCQRVRLAAGEPVSNMCRSGLTCTSDVCTAAAGAGGTGTAAEEEPAPPPTRTPGEFNYRNPLGSVSINELLGRIIRTALGFVGALFLIMFVYGGTTWMLAGGDSKKVESGQRIIINAVIGMVIVAISYSIISIIFETASVIRGG